MKTLKSWRFVAIASLAVAAGSALVIACTGDDGSDTLTPGSDASTKADTNTGTPDSNTGADAPDDTATPQGVPPGCFSGTPVNTLDFQNACTTEAYIVFDNCARIGYCDGGSLPALVTPPPDASVPDSAVADTSTPDAAEASTDAATDGG